MPNEDVARVAIVYPGDEEARRTATVRNNRFAPLFSAFADAGIQAEPAVYHDDVCQALREQSAEVFADEVVPLLAVTATAASGT